jgi:hypothetical protein
MAFPADPNFRAFAPRVTGVILNAFDLTPRVTPSSSGIASRLQGCSVQGSQGEAKLTQLTGSNESAIRLTTSPGNEDSIDAVN